ncbi:MAG TPA: multidrug effflux MFS transporter [Sphingobium sp.]|uniref:multidrug effflux MFS transporter n=1 Tax=Sphingobium sp. TaxID=1912891 RepID=UPI002ED59C66
MSSATPSPPAKAGGAIPFREFVTIVAMLMAINALGVDSMLPALPHIAHSLGMTTANQQQWVISAYILGMGASQIIYGPIADRFGRRTPVLFCLFLYAAMSIFASLATSFTAILVARILQGMGAAGTRVISVAMVRDRYEGREMARVMSLAFMIFLAVPMLAPSVGALIMLVAPWRSIFHVLAGFSAFVAVWIVLRVPETLHPEYRRPIEVKPLFEAIRTVVTNRTSIGYTAALTMSFGGMVGFINSAQQLFTGTFHGTNAHFPIFFAFVAGGMAVASFTNSQIVMRLGTRRVSHTALILFIALTGVHLATTALLGDNLTSFALFQCAMLFCAGLMGSNFGAMAMEPMGAIAGTASAVQGMLSTLGGALIGVAIGQSYDGTATPVVAGYFICSLGILCAVLYAEGGRLLRPHHADPAKAG